MFFVFCFLLDNSILCSLHFPSLITEDLNGGAKSMFSSEMIALRKCMNVLQLYFELYCELRMFSACLKRVSWNV